MKNIIIIAVIILACMSSCKKYLETSSPSSLSGETVFKTSSMTKAAPGKNPH